VTSTAVDLRPFAKRNCWTTADGQLCVRPGIRRVYAAESGRTIVAGFSVRNETSGEVWHYVFDVASTGTKALKLRILDEDFQTFQVFALNVDVEPRGVSFSITNGQIVICSPDFPTLWGLIGSSVRYAAPVDSISGSTSLAIPRGICTEWGGRCVIFDGRNMFVSDPIAVTGGSPQTFIAENQNQRPGVVYGAHEGAGGMLVLVTSAGVYGLDSSAAAVGIVGSHGADWRLLNHHQATSYDSSCVVGGRVFALTAAGWAVVDTDTQEEYNLVEPSASRAFGSRFALDDHRTERMFAMDQGPVIGSDTLSGIHMTDLRSSWQCSSWWTATTGDTSIAGMNLRGVLRMPDGGQALLTTLGAHLLTGNGDGTSALSSASYVPAAHLVGNLPSAPSQNRRINQIHVGGAVGGSGLLRCSLRGEGKTATPDADAEGLTIGASTWETATRLLTATPITDRRFAFTRNPMRDICLEVGADVGMARISPVAVLEESESAQKRPSGVT
jgi:hypothetical protein